MSASGYDYTNEKLRRIAVDEDGKLITKPEGVYLEEAPTLVDGEQHRLTLTVDGKLRVDIPPAGVNFTDLAGGEDHAPPGPGAWWDWDISAIIPAGSKAALIMMSNIETHPLVMGARKNGTALDRKDDVIEGADLACRWAVCVLTECDANRVIEIWAEDEEKAFFQVMGYWS